MDYNLDDGQGLNIAKKEFANLGKLEHRGVIIIPCSDWQVDEASTIRIRMDDDQYPTSGRLPQEDEVYDAALVYGLNLEIQFFSSSYPPQTCYLRKERIC